MSVGHPGSWLVQFPNHMLWVSPVGPGHKATSFILFSIPCFWWLFSQKINPCHTGTGSVVFYVTAVQMFEVNRKTCRCIHCCYVSRALHQASFTMYSNSPMRPLPDLHWLPVVARIQFKTMVLALKTAQGQHWLDHMPHTTQQFSLVNCWTFFFFFLQFWKSKMLLK